MHKESACYCVCVNIMEQIIILVFLMIRGAILVSTSSIMMMMMMMKMDCYSVICVYLIAVK